MAKMASEAVEGPLEAEEVATEVVAPIEAPKGFIVALDGDNYRTIAERVGKVTAEELHALNGEAPVYVGGLVRIK